MTRPILLLTRPEPQSRGLAEAFAGLAEVIVSPVMRIEATGAVPDLAGLGGVILTSANAVPHAPALAGIRVYCVGKRTAEAAAARGAEVRLVAQDADDLVARIAAEGPLLHLRGAHARGDIAERLSLAGTETHEAVIYRQVAVPLSAEARAALAGDEPAIVPLYSPRSARLVGAEAPHPGPRVRAVAMSPAVADAWAQATGGVAEVCEAPTGAAMEARIRAALRG